MLAKGQLPHKLQLLLSHSRIRKAGRLVNSDLLRLQDMCLSSSSFVGGLDLAKYAKEWCIVANISKCSLSDLCALVLQKCLNKNVPERISQAWENWVLTAEQLSYAAKDAYASLRIYEELSKLDVPVPLPALFQPHTPVILYSTDNTTIIATGQISVHKDDKVFDAINISPTWTIVDVSEVRVPGAIIATHGKRPLDSFGPVPFSIVFLRSHLRTYSPSTFQTQVQPLPVLPSPCHHSSMVGSLNSHPDQLGSMAETEVEDGASIGALLSQDLSGSSTSEDFPRNMDSPSKATGAEILGHDPEHWDNVIHSCVLKDIWHVFNMFYISATHGLRKQFTRELRDAIFIPDEEDKTRINIWGSTQAPPRTYEILRNSCPQWLQARCKHIIPPPNILYPLVANVFRTYGPLIDSDSKKPLFTPDNWKTAKNILELIKNGYLSDPPGIPLYTVIGLDKKAGGLPIYRCACGTNSTEGGVHTHIRSRLPKFGASICHVQAALLDFTLRHNLLVCNFIFKH
jgi:hypothetical protein